MEIIIAILLGIAIASGSAVFLSALFICLAIMWNAVEAFRAGDWGDGIFRLFMGSLALCAISVLSILILSIFNQ